MARLSRPGQLWLNTKMVYSTMCCAMKDSVVLSIHLFMA